MKKLILIVVTILSIGVFASVAYAYRQPDIEGAGQDGWIAIGLGENVKRIDDKDNGITCWVLSGTTNGNAGISCVKQ